MPMKEPQRQVYRTARGVEIDMGKLINKNELAVAVGNAGVNARGDKLGPGGKIVKRREELISEMNTVPDQLNIRQPAIEPSAPFTEKPTVTGKPVKKEINDQDPEGNE